MGVNTDLICSFSEILMALGGAPLHLQWRARIGYGGFDPQRSNYLTVDCLISGTAA